MCSHQKGVFRVATRHQMHSRKFWDDSCCVKDDAMKPKEIFWTHKGLRRSPCGCFHAWTLPRMRVCLTSAWLKCSPFSFLEGENKSKRKKKNHGVTHSMEQRVAPPSRLLTMATLTLICRSPLLFVQSSSKGNIDFSQRWQPVVLFAELNPYFYFVFCFYHFIDLKKWCLFFFFSRRGGKSACRDQRRGS